MRKLSVKRQVENNSIEGALDTLANSIARRTDRDGLHETAISALSLSRLDAPNQPTSYMYEPSICLVAQGVKRVLLGDDTYVLDVHHFFDHVRGSTHGCAGYQGEPGEALSESPVEA